MNWSLLQKNIFDAYEKTSSNLVISARAGSSKTTVILELLKRKKMHRKAIYLVFNKSIAEESKKKVPFGVDVSTIHSYGAKMLFKHYDGQIEVKPSKVFGYSMKFVKEWELDKNPKKFEYLGTVSDLVNLYRMYMCQNSNDLKEVSDYHGITCLNGEVNHAIQLMDSLTTYMKYGPDEGKRQIDFTDMIYFPAINDEMEFNRYDEVFIDEAQDLSKTQQIIIKKILKPNGRFVAVGDPYQSIYQFLSADSEAFKNFEKQPNTISLPLSISYRCPKKVVALANTVFNVTEAFEGNIEGEVREGSINEVDSGDFVLCRNNLPLVEAYLNFLVDGKKAYIKGKDLGDGLLKLVSKIEDKTLSDGLAYLKDFLNETWLDIKKNGSSNPTNHPRYISLQEKVSIINVLVNKYTSFPRLKDALKEMFVDDPKNGIILSTIHKSKGLESDNIFVLRRELIPSQYAEKAWELDQEKNLLYVMYTRAKQRLIFITDF